MENILCDFKPADVPVSLGPIAKSTSGAVFGLPSRLSTYAQGV